MRYVSGFFTVVLVGILILFAASNKEETRLELFPLPQQITAPLYLIAFLLIFSGFLLGGLTAWNAGRKHRRSSRQSGKRIQILEGDLSSMRSRAESAEERATQLVTPQRDPVAPSLPVDNPELL